MDANGTPAAGTGPSDDVTGGGKYLYIKTSQYCSDARIARSPTFNISALANGAEFAVYYHMYGTNDLGEFSVQLEDLSNSPGTYTTLFGPIANNQGNAWHNSDWVALPPRQSLVRFRVMAPTMPPTRAISPSTNSACAKRGLRTTRRQRERYGPVHNRSVHR
ncbi:MAG: hypothetical protein R2818_12935 [Flavobacteriales bacterium]